MTQALAFPEPPYPIPTAAISPSPTPARPWVLYRDPGCLALILEGLGLRGRTPLYAGTAPRLLSIATDARVRSLLPPQRRWELPPIAQVVRAAQRGIPQVLREGKSDLAVLGMMCLPPTATEVLLNPATRGKHALVVDGIDFNTPDGRLAAAGIEALARRTGEFILVLP